MDPDTQTHCFEQSRLEQSREEELFQRIMGEAKQEQTPLDDLLDATLRLAFPQGKDSDIERALGALKARSAEWQNRLDQGGNPCWISLAPQEPDESQDTAQPDAKRPSGTKDAKRPAHMKDAQHPPDNPADTKDAAPPKKTPAPSFARGLIRLVVFAGIVMLAYHFLVVRGGVMP